MARYGLAINVERCTGCYNCVLSCKDEFAGNDYLPLSAAQPDGGLPWIRLQEIEHGTGSKVKVDYIPMLCQQCEDAPCITSDGAVYRRSDGVVIIDPARAKGRKEIVDSCPYGAIHWNEASQLAQKCTLCAHMTDKGENTTRCVEACPTQAMAFGDLDDPSSPVSQVLKAKQEKVECFKPEFGTKPAVRYIGLPKPFIAGEILLDGKDGECAKGVKVVLIAKTGDRAVTTETDFLGDFEFKGLAAGAEYVIRAECEGYLAKELTVRTDKSVNVGELVLTIK